jgi:DNA-binding MarR family transcriptional regulator
MFVSPTISEAIGNLQRLTDLFSERREQLAREAGLTVQQWRILEEITDEHFMPSMFARSQESSAAAVSKIIRQLLDKILITVAVSETDGRQRRYTLTENGQKVMAQLRDNRQRAIEAIWAGFPQTELENFAAFSRRLADQLQAYAELQAQLPEEERDVAVASI